MQKCYIAGKVTGLPEGTYQKLFRKAEITVAILGYEPVNPVVLPHADDKSWLSYMREAMTAMLGCEVLFALLNWRESKGAVIEVNLAAELGMKVIFEEDLKLKPMTTNPPDLYQEALTFFGEASQQDKLVEEMAELTQAIMKYRRKPSEKNRQNLHEEFADVQLVMQQIKLTLDEETVNAYTCQKLARLYKLIHK